MVCILGKVMVGDITEWCTGQGHDVGVLDKVIIDNLLDMAMKVVKLDKLIISNLTRS